MSALRARCPNCRTFTAVAVGDGWAEFEMQPAEWHYNPIGSVHGGMLAGLADSALGCAVHTKLPAGTGYTSLDVTIKFTRAARLEGGLLRCRAEVVTIGRRTATAEARIVDSHGRPSRVTTAGAAPSLGEYLLLAYLPPEHAVEGNKLGVVYMNEQFPVTVARVGSQPLFDPDDSRMKT